MAKRKTGTILITGATGGIGSALCLRLVGQGYRVVATARSRDGLEALAAKGEGRIVPLPLDLTDDVAVAVAAGPVGAAVGGDGLQGLVNTAGMIVDGPLELVPPADLRTAFDVNVVGPHALTRAVLPLLRRGQGRVVNIGAISAIVPVPFYGAISAPKAALSALNDVMRMEFAHMGIAVVLIDPGALATGIFDTAAARQARMFEGQPERLLAHYRPAMAAMREAFAKTPPDTPEVVVDAVLKALGDRKPRPHVVAGAGAAQFAALRKLPIAARDAVVLGALGLAKALKTAPALDGQFRN